MSPFLRDSVIQFLRSEEKKTSFLECFAGASLDLPPCADPAPPEDDDDRKSSAVVEFELPIGAEAAAAAADPEGGRRIVQPAMLQVFKGNRNAR